MYRQNIMLMVIGSVSVVRSAGQSQAVQTCQMSQNFNVRNHISHYWMFSEICMHRQGAYNTTVECAVRCAREEKCVTYMANELEGRCRLHAAQVSEHSPLQPTDGFVSFDSCRANSLMIGYPCKTHMSCALTYTLCYDQTCQCGPGYNFSPRTKSCVTGTG